MFGCKGNKPCEFTRDDKLLLGGLVLVIIALVVWARWDRLTDDDWKTWRDEDKGFSIDYPGAWSASGPFDSVPDHPIRLMLGFDDRYSSSHPTCTVCVEKLAPGREFSDEYLEHFFGRFEDFWNGANNCEVEEKFVWSWIEIDGERAASFKAILADTGEYPNQMRVSGVLLTRDGQIYQVQCLCDEEDAVHWERYFDLICESFRFL